VTLQSGDLVGLLDGRGPQLAVVQGLRGSRLELRVGFEGRSQLVPPRDVHLLIPYPPGGQAPPQRLDNPPWCLGADRLAAVAPSSRPFAEAWWLLAEECQRHPRDLPLRELVELLGDGDDPALVAACWIWLQGDQTFFRLRQGQIVPRTALELRQLRRERHRLRLEEGRRLAWQRALVARQPLDVTGLSSAQRQDLAELRSWASGQTERPLAAELLRHLRQAHCAAEPGAIRHLLADLGQWERHHLPSLEATTWQLGFAAPLLEEADRLVALAASPLPGDERRLDLGAQHVVTIDDVDTLDIDDGLALEVRPDGAERLWIHIADPGRLVTPGSPLDQEARRRGSSLYLARGSLPMFPPQLAHGPMGLRCGQRTAAWSLWAELAGDGALERWGIERSWIQPRYRLTYGDADELLELAPPQEAALLRLQQLLESRRQWRLAQGALQLEDPEGRIRCRGERAEVEVIEPSASRRLVAEAMVLAGALVAEWGQQQAIALPYRSQAPSDLPPAAELERLPAGPVRHAAIKRCLGRSQVGTTPGRHFSLGLPAYVQATSPIRRYADLVVQRQLEALWNGDDPLGEAALGELLQELEGPVRQGIQIAREDQRHWLQVWVEQGQHRQWPGLFLRWLRPDHQLALVWLEEIAQSLPCHCPARLEPGDRLLVRVAAVDSLRDVLRLEASA
jgi:exoribonuclease-2